MPKASKKLSIKIITLFPKFIENFVDSFGIVKRAIKNNLLDVQAIDLRQFGLDERKTVDNPPYGGGVGMVLRADVLYKAIESARKFQIPNNKFQIKSKIKNFKSKARVILLTPQGQKFNQQIAQRLSKYDQLILVCGRYEGFDERIRQFVDEEISIGDYVLMGGELPALVISEAVMRLRPGILGKDESSVGESFSPIIPKIDGRTKSEWLQLEYPQYTKPEIWTVPGRGRPWPPAKTKNGRASSAPTRSRLKKLILRVPKVLLTGHHKNIEEFRKAESAKRTRKRRPDLLVM